MPFDPLTIGVQAALSGLLGWLKDKLKRDDPRIKGQVTIQHPENCVFIFGNDAKVISNVRQLVEETGAFGIARKRMIPYNDALLSNEGAAILDALTGYLAPREMTALKIAYSILDLEASQETSQVPEIVENHIGDLKGDLANRFPDFGLRIYNLAATGVFEYFAGIIPGIEQTTRNSTERRRRVRLTLRVLLFRNEPMVFTNASMSPKQIREDIVRRMRNPRLGEIFVFARGANVERVDCVCSALAKDMVGTFTLATRHYRMGGSVASANVFTRIHL